MDLYFFANTGGRSQLDSLLSGNSPLTGGGLTVSNPDGLIFGNQGSPYVAGGTDYTSSMNAAYNRGSAAPGGATAGQATAIAGLTTVTVDAGAQGTLSADVFWRRT